MTIGLLEGVAVVGCIGFCASVLLVDGWGGNVNEVLMVFSKLLGIKE